MQICQNENNNNDAYDTDYVVDGLEMFWWFAVMMLYNMTTDILHIKCSTLISNRHCDEYCNR